MSGDFAGKVAFVTGAASGIGRASAVAFAARGAAVVVCDLAEPADTVAEVERLGATALPFQLDVSDGDALRDAVDAAVRAFGRLDYAHNNAGTFAVAPLADLTEADFARDRRDVHNMPAALLLHRWNHGTNQTKRRGQIR